MSSLSIVAAITDLMLRSRLAEPAGRLGFDVASADSTDEALDRLTNKVSLVVVDLQAGEIDWRRVAAAAGKQGVPVLAFGRHTNAKALRAARDAGCTRVVPRSTLVAELPELLRELVRRPV